MSKKIVAALVAVLLSVPAFATDYVVHVHGLVCSFCAHGVSKNISKLSFIDLTKHKQGVRVEIEQQKLTIAVKPDHDLDIHALFDAIEAGGYEPVDVWTVLPSGELDEPVEYEP